jgi:hypothetical protein
MPFYALWIMQTNALKPIVWGGGISANDLLTRRDLGRFAALCNNGAKSVEGEYYLYKNWQSSFPGCPTYIRIRNGVEGHE